MYLSLCTGNDIEKVVLDSKDKGLYVVNTEVWQLAFSPDDPVTIRAAYNPSGHYIGDAKLARHLCDKLGIAPEVANPNHHKVCSIGYSKKDGKWYGWSHRALYGFKIGDTVKKGDCAYTPSRGEWAAQTVDDARQMAMDFAASVSSGDLLSNSADMKMQSYVYMDDRPARMQSGDRVLRLVRGSQFRLSMYKGYPCVVRDGVIYIIRADLVKELKNRSRLVRPDKEVVEREKLFDVLGHEMVGFVTQMARKLTKGQIDADFNNGVAYAKWVQRAPTGEVTCALEVSATSVSAFIFKPNTLDLKGWDFFPKLQQVAKRLAQLVDSRGVLTGRFSSGRSVVANIGVPWGGHFSGTVLSYYSKIDITHGKKK